MYDNIFFEGGPGAQPDPAPKLVGQTCRFAIVAWRYCTNPGPARRSGRAGVADTNASLGSATPRPIRYVWLASLPARQRQPDRRQCQDAPHRTWRKLRRFAYAEAMVVAPASWIATALRRFAPAGQMCQVKSKLPSAPPSPARQHFGSESGVNTKKPRQGCCLGFVSG